MKAPQLDSGSSDPNYVRRDFLLAAAGIALASALPPSRHASAGLPLHAEPLTAQRGPLRTWNFDSLTLQRAEIGSPNSLVVFCNGCDAPDAPLADFWGAAYLDGWACIDRYRVYHDPPTIGGSRASRSGYPGASFQLLDDHLLRRLYRDEWRPGQVILSVGVYMNDLFGRISRFRVKSVPRGECDPGGIVEQLASSPQFLPLGL